MNFSKNVVANVQLRCIYSCEFFSRNQFEFSMIDAMFLQERFTGKEQKISENFYVRGDGTVSCYSFRFMLLDVIKINPISHSFRSAARGLSTSQTSSWKVFSKETGSVWKNMSCVVSKWKTDRKRL